MTSVHDVMLYFCKRYPHKQELSKARLTKMVYLADWRAAITEGRQLTDLEWTFNHYGPYLDDVVAEAQASPQHFSITTTTNMYGSRKDLIQSVDGAPEPDLNPAETAILDHVIHETEKLHFNDFIKLVYSTYPIVTQPRYEALDLVSLADQYAQLQATLPSTSEAQ